MLRSTRLILFVLAVVIGGTMSACSWNIERNDDGTWTVTGHITEAEMQDEIAAVISDPLTTNVQADFKDGYILGTADRASLDGSQTFAVTFRVDVGIVDGHMNIVISDFRLDGEPVNESRVSLWNERIATRLEQGRSRRDAESTLISVTITETDMTLVWISEGRRNR